jgi:long-chain fatty acid transport protein
MGMANAFVAQANDPSALFFNPAGIAFQSGNQLSTGVTVINVPETEFNGTRQPAGSIIHEQSRKDIFFPPNVYITKSLESLPLSFGLGVNSLYPLAKRWNSAGNFRDLVEDIAIKPLNFQPTVAYRLDKLNLGLAAGVDVTYAIVQLRKRTFNTGLDIGELDVEGTGSGVGYNWGLLWKPIKTVSLGVSYRSEVKLDLEGDAGWVANNYIASAMPLLGLPTEPVLSSVSTDITLPDAWKFGVAWQPNDKLTVEVDADRFGWSSYDKLELTFGPELAALGFNNKPTPKNWKDVWSYRLGTQYAVNPSLDLRAGYGYDNTPVPDGTLGPELPDSDRHNVSFGFGLHDDRAAFDFAYMWVKFEDRTVSNEIQQGTYENDAHLVAMNLTYKF